MGCRKDDEEEPGRLELISQAQKAKRRKAAQKAGPGKQGSLQLEEISLFQMG